MKKTLAFLIINIFTVVIVFFILAASVFAMSKRPKKNAQTDNREFVSPEIQIISKPETDVQILSDNIQKKNQAAAITSVDPKEILPAVGKDSSVIANSIRINDIQQALKIAGFAPGPIDGKLGPKTKKAIRDFQKTHNLTVDGLVGEKTWKELSYYLNPSEEENN